MKRNELSSSIAIELNPTNMTTRDAVNACGSVTAWCHAVLAGTVAYMRQVAKDLTAIRAESPENAARVKRLIDTFNLALAEGPRKGTGIATANSARQYAHRFQSRKKVLTVVEYDPTAKKKGSRTKSPESPKSPNDAKLAKENAALAAKLATAQKELIALRAKLRATEKERDDAIAALAAVTGAAPRKIARKVA